MLIGHNCELTLLANQLAAVDIYNVPTCGIVGCSLASTAGSILSRYRQSCCFLTIPKKQNC